MTTPAAQSVSSHAPDGTLTGRDWDAILLFLESLESQNRRIAAACWQRARGACRAACCACPGKRACGALGHAGRCRGPGRGRVSTPRADRAAPAGGLGERGAITVSCGASSYTARLGAGLQIVLKDAQGQVVRALRVWGPDAAAARRTWQDLRRLPAPAAGLDVDGRLLSAFRPTEDGSCISAASDPVDLGAFAAIRVAHRVLLDEPDISAWSRRFEDCQLVPLFAQLH